MSKLDEYSLPELYGLFLRFCSSKEVINLRRTSKSFYKKIPASWEATELFIQYEQSLEHLTDYRFLNRLSVTFHNIKKLSLSTRFEQLDDLTLVKLNNLEEIKLDPRLRRVQRIFINYAKKLTRVDIPQTYTCLDMIYLSHLNISTFTIWHTWSQIQVVALVGIPRIKTLIIPEECTRLNYLNISQSGISEIYLHPYLNDLLTIQATEMHTPVVLYTHPKNNDHLQTTCVIVLKTI
jgi:hypothetical protein